MTTTSPQVSAPESARMDFSARPRCKVAIVATHPIQYQAPLWRQLARRPDLQVKVFFGTDMSVRGYRDEGFGVTLRWDTPLLEGYEHEFLSTDARIQRVNFWVPGGGAIFSRLQVFAPDVVLLTAYRGRYHLGALRAARRLGARVIMRHEASDVAEQRSPLKARMRDWLLRRLYARVDGFAAIGQEARRHLVRLGIPSARIGSAPYCIDSDFMEWQVALWQPERDRLRAEMRVQAQDVVLVFSGKLTPKKNPLLLASALASLSATEREQLHLVVAGAGDLREALEQAVRPLLQERLHLLGFLNQSQIGRAYAVGDALVLPSLKGAGETWGLVVNEAMQFRLPAIVSDGVGCHPDLVAHGETGFLFASGDAAGLAASIRALLALPPAYRRRLGERARTRVGLFSLEAAADGLAQAVRLAASDVRSGV